MNNLPSQNVLLEKFTYDKDTGIFKLKKSRNIVGSLDKSTGYIRIYVLNKQYYAHRLAWVYENGDNHNSFIIDHIDHNKQNNSIANLRISTYQENSKNRPLQRNNSSGFNGVRFCNNQKKFIVQIKVNSKVKTIGRFLSLESAISARDEANDIFNFHKNHGK